MLVFRGGMRFYRIAMMDTVLKIWVARMERLSMGGGWHRKQPYNCAVAMN
jgi:hypothetical protein